MPTPLEILLDPITLTMLAMFAALALAEHMLLRTFENPRRFEHPTGFWDGASARVLDMLLARDVSRPNPTQP